MTLSTIFCTTPQLAEQLGIDGCIIRTMCETKIIPSEFSNGHYRILRARAVKFLTKRAEEYEGYYSPECSLVLGAILINKAMTRRGTVKQQLLLDPTCGLI